MLRFDWCIIVASRSKELSTCHTFVRRFPSKSEKQLITLTNLYMWTMEMQITYTTVYCSPPIENVFANWTQFFVSCHELVEECNQHTYGSRALAGEHTKHVHWLRWFETLIAVLNSSGSLWTNSWNLSPSQTFLCFYIWELFLLNVYLIYVVVFTNAFTVEIKIYLVLLVIYLFA